MVAPEPRAAWREFAGAPLAFPAIAMTVGLYADRSLGIATLGSLFVVVLALIFWRRAQQQGRLAVPFLWLAAAGLGAAHHHSYRSDISPDDIGFFTTKEPSVVRVRAILDEAPSGRQPSRNRLEPRKSSSESIAARVTALAATDGSWLPASGGLLLHVVRDAETSGRAPLPGLRAGDAIEATGFLTAPHKPVNPGERDHSEALKDRRIHAELHVNESAAIVRLEEGVYSRAGILAQVRQSAAALIDSSFSEHHAGLARALLLGDGTAMAREEWDIYIRTGVVHAIAVSGQHLAILAAFLGIVLRLLGVSRRRGAWIVLGVVFVYILITGARPSGVRALVMTATVCGAVLLRRRAITANSFCLAWISVAVLDPNDLFTLGCKLSFLSVFVLVWGASRWTQPRPLTPVEKLIDSVRPEWLRLLRALARAIGRAYLITFLLGLANMPLLLEDQNVVSPVGLLIGPPIVGLTTIALVGGFLTLVAGALGLPTFLVAWPVDLSLGLCSWLTRLADGVPGGAVYLPGPGFLALVGFHLLLAGGILLTGMARRYCFLALGIGTVLSVAVSMIPTVPSDVARVTFLAVGKGGCTVIETPDGRCFVYDVGSTSGPGVVRRVVAPYLWHRGIRKIDELFLSHADSDHFNGIEELLRRFPVGRIVLTPSFAEKPTEEVAAALGAIALSRTPTRIATAGEQLRAGDVELEVLHPPEIGPAGTENERSLTLLFRHEGQTILLTGDLEKAGVATVLSGSPRRADILMAPHHGSKGAEPVRLAAWASARFVIASRGIARGNSVAARDLPASIGYADTQDSGAVTIRSHRTGIVLETFRDGRLITLRGKER